VQVLPDPRPAKLNNFGWCWETEGEFTKLLCFCFGEGIAQDQVWHKIIAKLDVQIELAKKAPLQYMEKDWCQPRFTWIYLVGDGVVERQ
jgi:hypothetical protein